MDPEPCPEDLLEYLRELGASDDELVQAAAAGRSGGLALELALRPEGGTVGFDEAAAGLGLGHEEAAQVWRALGFADPGPGDELRLAADEVRALGLLATSVASLIGTDSTLALSRVAGASTARMAEAIVDTFRSEFEHPRRAGGTSYADVVREYGDIATSLLPSFLELFGAVLRRHLVDFAASNWAFDESPTTRRDLVIGFCDLVGYTALSGRASPSELTSLITRFGAVADEVASMHRGRVVKLLGDAAMFVCDEPEDGIAIGLDLLAGLAAEPDLPPARVGLATGTVVTLHGDFYGSVVNLAARLLSAAAPGSLVVAADLAAVAGALADVEVEALDPLELKGFEEPQQAHAVRRALP